MAPALLFFLFEMLGNCRVYWVSESLYMHNLQIGMFNMRYEVHLGNMPLISAFLPFLLMDDLDSVLHVKSKQTDASSCCISAALNQDPLSVFHLLLWEGTSLLLAQVNPSLELWI